MKHAWLLLLLVGAVACSSDDDSEGRYSGVVKWGCFDLEPGCECVGLGKGDAFMTNHPAVDSCEGYACCMAYQDAHDDWMCTCLAPAAACEPREGWTSVETVSRCPPQ